MFLYQRLAGRADMEKSHDEARSGRAIMAVMSDKKSSEMYIPHAEDEGHNTAEILE